MMMWWKIMERYSEVFVRIRRNLKSGARESLNTRGSSDNSFSSSSSDSCDSSRETSQERSGCAIISAPPFFPGSMELFMNGCASTAAWIASARRFTSVSLLTFRRKGILYLSLVSSIRYSSQMPSCVWVSGADKSSSFSAGTSFCCSELRQRATSAFSISRMLMPCISSLTSGL